MLEYYFENNKPIHRMSYCAFLDVLGFSNRIIASNKDGTYNELLRQFHSVFNKRIKILESDTNQSPMQFKSFSDNILLAHPQCSEDMESEFGFILWSIREFQFNMAIEGFFIRGGLSVGNLFIDDNSVYGEALINSYELEHKIAVNPIVVLCDETMKLVNQHINYYSGSSAPQFRDVIVNSDGRYFINYLSECIVETENDVKLDVASLITHKEKIEEALLSYIDQPAIFSKFSWLSAYHNYFCDLVSLYPNYSNNIKISSDISTVKFKKLLDLF